MLRRAVERRAARRRQASRASRLALCTALALSAGLATLARADEITGTWTGAVSARGHYYWEESTRVVAPELQLQLVSPEGVQVQVDYLVDAITSASQAAGALTDSRFTEIRHDVGVGVGYEWDLGPKKLHLSSVFRVSREPDYTSVAGTVVAALSLFDRSTILTGSLTVLHDEVRQNFRGGSGVRPGGDGSTSDSGFEENFDAIGLGLTLEQALSPRAFAQLGYDLGYLSGYLANPYRLVSVANVLRPEIHPDTRLRQTVWGRLAYHLPPTATSVHLLYRAYLDSWGIGALTPEVRLYQRLTPFSFLRMRYRYYRQTRASFYLPDPNDYLMTDVLVSADPKMSAFHAHEVGGQLRLQLGFLHGSVLDRLARSTIDFNVDYIWRTNSFGNAVVAQMGLTCPF